ncbi:MAG: GNAT family N-acetyltransferase [bacterium]|nr:GNAT family N-acetyltransferase [bacterium]
MLTVGCSKTLTLKNGCSVEIRFQGSEDFENLLAFYQALPDEDRLFLRHDVCDPNVVRRWTEELDLEHIVPLLTCDEGRIVATGRLHIMTHGWMRHVAHIRLVTAPSHRRQGLGALMAQELVAVAADRDIEKIQAHVIEDNSGAIRMFEAVGFKTAAILPDMVKDQNGRPRNLAIMVNDVANLNRILENWYHESMIPSYRVPGAGVM